MKSWFLNRMGMRSTLVGSLSLLLVTVSAQTYNYTGSSQTFTVPAGQTNRVTIKVWGAGGGGGTRTTSNNNAAGGGGGGAYSQLNITLDPGSYTINVGGGGTSGTNGGASSFRISPTFIITANGGASGSGSNTFGGNGGAAQNGFTTLAWAFAGGSNIAANGGGDGGDGNTGTGGYGGGGGGAAGATGNGGNASFFNRNHGNGNGASGDGGDGANTNNNAEVGTVPGGGGGGGFRTNGSNSRPGLAGGNGRVEVTVLQVLPVTFESVSATTGGNDLLANFTTLEEVNNDHFNIQGSENGTDFQTIATVKSKHTGAVFTGATSYAVRIDKSGNTVLLGLSVLAVAALALGGARRNRKLFMSAVLGYVLIGMAAVSCSKNGTEIVPEKGNQNAFIRIEQVDADGHSSYSKIVAVVKN